MTSEDIESVTNWDALCRVAHGMMRDKGWWEDGGRGDASPQRESGEGRMTKWKLVPVEPTPTQLRGLDLVLGWDPPPDSRQVYRDVLDDAPERAIPAARLAEMREAVLRYGPANCWTGTTGTLAAMVFELLKTIGEERET